MYISNYTRGGEHCSCSCLIPVEQHRDATFFEILHHCGSVENQNVTGILSATFSPI